MLLLLAQEAAGNGAGDAVLPEGNHVDRVTGKALEDLEAAIVLGTTRERAWTRLWGLAAEKDKLLTGEVNRHKITADMINADRVAAFMVGMIDALREESQDPKS